MRALAFVVVAGCASDTGNLDFTGPEYAVSSADGVMIINACATSGLLGCENTPDVPMAADLDGVATALPGIVPGFLALFPQYDHLLRVASPADPNLTLSGPGGSIAVEELPWFTVEIPPAPPRAPLVVHFQRYPNADVTAALETTCGDVVANYQSYVPVDDTVALSFPTSTDACQHAFTIAQVTHVDSDIHAIVTVARTQHYAFATNP